MTHELSGKKNPLRTSLWQTGLLVIGGILFAILMAEFLARVLYKQKPAGTKAAFKSAVHETVLDLNLLYLPTPGAETVIKGDAHKINSTGFRDREFSVEKTPGTERILFLGDSVVYGYEIALEETLPKQLEKKLREAGKNVEVLNFGVSGYETRQQVEFFKRLGRQYKPDAVILGYTLNDSRFASFELNQFNDENKWHVPSLSLRWYQRIPSFFYRHMKLLQYLDREKGFFDRKEKWRFILRGEKDAWHYVRDENKLREDAADSPYRQLGPKISAAAEKLGTREPDLKTMLDFTGFYNYEMYRSHWNISKKAIEELRDLSKKDGFELKAAIFPFLWSLDRYPLTPLHEFLKSELLEMEIPIIDSLDAMKKAHQEKGGEITLDGVHFSPAGASLWADEAAKNLGQRT